MHFILGQLLIIIVLLPVQV